MDDTSYVDSDLELGRGYSYQVRMLVQSGDTSYSNQEGLTFYGRHIMVEWGGIGEMIVDREAPLIYAMTGDGSLVMINTELNSTEEYLLPQPMESGNMDNLRFDVSLAEGELVYLGDDDRVRYFDLQTRTFVREHGLETTSIPSRGIQFLTGNRVVAVRQGSAPINLIDTQTGNVVDRTEAQFFGSALATSPDGVKLYLAELSDRKVHEFVNMGDSLHLLRSVEYQGTAHVSRVVVSGNGRYLFYKGQKIDSESFEISPVVLPQPLWSANFDGSLMVTRSGIYNTETQQQVRSFPGLSVHIALFHPLLNELYVYDISSDRILILQMD